MRRLLVAAGRFFGRRTFDDLLSTYVDVLASRPYKPQTRAQYRCDIGHLRRAFGGRPLAGIEPHHVAAMVRTIVDAGTPVAARMALTTARDAFHEALIRGWIASNPADHVRPPKAPVQRQRMTLEQWHAIHEAGKQVLPAWWSAAWTLALVSGQRRADLVKMRFADVHDGWLHVDQQKTGAMLALPLELRLGAIGVSIGDAVAACTAYGKPGEHLIRSPKLDWGPITPKTLTRQAIYARQAAGIVVPRGTPPALHEVRSLAERLYRAQGVDTKTLLGHRKQSMTDLYNNDRGLSAGDRKFLRL